MERRELLMSRLAADGRLVAADLARELSVSDDTIRRDLRELAAEGRLQRVHGGALPSSPALAGYAARRSIATAGKAAIGALAASLVPPRATIVLDGGTTALEVARALDPTVEVSVVTHSPTVAVALVDHPRADVLLLGGRLFKHSVVTCGAITAEAARGVHADLCFLGVTGVHPRHGLTTGDADEAAIKRTLGGRAAETFVLASAEKVGAVSPHRVLPWNEVTAVLTDREADRTTLGALRRAGVDVRVAP